MYCSYFETIFVLLGYNINMQNILIIGGTSGIGNAIANQLNGQANLFITGRTEKNIAHLSNSQFTNFNAAEELNTSFLPEQIHGIVYCPGTINLKPFNRLTADDLITDFTINVVGAFKVIKACLPNLKKAEKSSIVLFSTVASNVGMPFHASIAAAKGALQSMAIAMAAEFANNGIRVNTIAPSLTDTSLASSLLANDDKKKAAAERHPLKKIGSATELASLAVYLLSSNAAFITGQIIGVDGGMGKLKV